MHGNPAVCTNPAPVDIRNSLVCAAVALIALLLAWPFSNLPFNDDWTWALTVLKLNQTGHLVYNGWSSPPVIAQAYWGWLWVKLFGFSFNVLRASSLPMASGAVCLCYMLARRADLTAAMAIFAALVLGLSPLYMPLECTFMTDAPGLFFMLLSFLALLHAYDANTKPASTKPTSTKPALAGWLTLGVISALVGGSSRQLVWIVPLVTLPYFAWLKRADRFFILISLAGWIFVFIGAAAMQHWYSTQPYALPDPPLLSYLKVARHYPKQSVIGTLCVLLTLVMLLLPVIAGLVRFRAGKIEITAVVICIAMYLVLRRLHHDLEPWMGNIFTSTGPLGSIEIGGGTPVVLGHRSRVALSLVTMLGASLLLAYGFFHASAAAAKAKKFATHSPVLAAMLLISLAMFALELTRVVSQVAYDRHLLPFIPFLVIPLLYAYQKSGLLRMPVLSWLLLLIYATYGIASTQEVNALARARSRAIARLESAGIGADQIEAGFEHNYWTQGLLAGHVNDLRVRNPANAYDRTKGPTPAMHMLYRLESEPTAVTSRTPFGTISYFSLLPPFHRTFCIDRFTDPWWLNPTRAATQPVERSLLPKVLLEQYANR
jgi:hypothetical protein